MTASGLPGSLLLCEFPLFVFCRNIPIQLRLNADDQPKNLFHSETALSSNSRTFTEFYHILQKCKSFFIVLLPRLQKSILQGCCAVVMFDWGDGVNEVQLPDHTLLRMMHKQFFFSPLNLRVLVLKIKNESLLLVLSSSRLLSGDSALKALIIDLM